MKNVIWLIGGTSEGRALIKAMSDLPIHIYVSVATSYGAELIEKQKNITILAERMDLEKMRHFLQKHKPISVIDATHPYATIVTDTIKKACLLENASYLRLLRPVGKKGDYISVQDFNEAIELLNQVEGNILLTTGSKNLKDFTAVKNYENRISLRILPMESSLLTALELGYKPANIICMQGPFSKELNVALLKKFNAKFLVTKDSGNIGGFAEKIEAATEAGAKLLVIDRAVKESGQEYEEILTYLRQKFMDK